MYFTYFTDIVLNEFIIFCMPIAAAGQFNKNACGQMRTGGGGQKRPFFADDL